MSILYSTERHFQCVRLNIVVYREVLECIDAREVHQETVLHSNIMESDRLASYYRPAEMQGIPGLQIEYKLTKIYIFRDQENLHH